MTTWADLRVRAADRLRATSSLAPDTEARWMVERVSGYDGVELVVGEHELATAPAIQHLDDMLERRAQGEPLQYSDTGVLELRPFVDSACRCPPKTRWWRRSRRRKPRLGLRRGRAMCAGALATEVVVDLGTLSGALALRTRRRPPRRRGVGPSTT
jgi:methylase of polypeptide subunit release factors